MAHLVGLLGEQGADETDHAARLGRSHDVGASRISFVETFLRIVGADLGPVLAGKALNAKMSSAASNTSLAMSQNRLG